MYGDDNLFESMINDFEAIEKDPNKNIEEQREISVGWDINGKKLTKGDMAFTDDGKVQGKVVAVWNDGSVDIEYTSGPGGLLADTFDIKGHGVQKLDRDTDEAIEEASEEELKKKIPSYDYDSDDEQLNSIYQLADDLFPQADDDGKEYLQYVMDEIGSILSRHERDYDLEARENEAKVDEGKLKEGMFSWHAGDTDEPIYSDEGHQKTVHMLDDKGNKYTEDNYEGYGVFGGKDFYILLGEMNGLALSGVQTSEEDHKAYYNDRDIAIKFAFGDSTDDDREGVKYPRFTTDPSISYEDLPNPRSHDNQGWFAEEEDEYEDPEYEDEYEDEYESIVDEEAEDGKKFGIVLTGGSVGSPDHKPKFFDTKEEANAYKKRMNKQLSAGEKGYYKLKYKTAKNEGTRMFGDKTEFESMINDFEAIEADEKKDVDEEEVKRCPECGNPVEDGVCTQCGWTDYEEDEEKVEGYSGLDAKTFDST